MANVGTLVLHRVIGEEFDPLFAQAQGDYAALVALCQEKLEIDPPAVSALLAEKWQFPPLLARPIALHYSCDEQDPLIKPLVDVVSTGVLLAEVFVAEDPARPIALARKELAARFNLPPEEIEKLLVEIGKSAREAAGLLEVHIGKERSYQEILGERGRQLGVPFWLQTQQQVAEHHARGPDACKIKATTDLADGAGQSLPF